MVCPQCNVDNTDSNKYCSNCGKKFEENATSQDIVFSPIVATAPVFSEKELKTLIDINRTISSADSKHSSVIQEDIDKLFE